MLTIEACRDVGDSKAFVFESFGVNVEIKGTKSEHLLEISKRLEKALPQNFRIIEKKNVDRRFFIEDVDDGKLTLFENEKELTGGSSEMNFFNFLESKVRLTVAEYAPSNVFLHAGVVAWNGKAIVLPANSFCGKTTLVKELVKLGAVYYSDEYAVLDEKGDVHPFPKTLSVRSLSGGYEQVEYSAESFGATVAKKSCPVGMILITEYIENAVWEPVKLSAGNGVMETILHAIPIRRNPEFTLKVLNQIVSRAIICKSSRGEAKEFAKKILDFFVLNT